MKREMTRKLGWLTLLVALAVPAAMAWAGEGKPDNAGGPGRSASAGEHSCCPCCCHDKACPR